MQNDHSTSIRREDMLKLLEISGHKVEVIDFSTLATEEEKKEGGKKEGGKKKEEEKKKGGDPSGDQRGIEYKKEENFSRWY